MINKKVLLIMTPFFISIFLFFTISRIGIVASGSMDSTLSTGDWLYSFIYHSGVSSEIERGDIISFKSNYSDKALVKRVIGLPGETVEIKAGHVYINGELLEEDYLTEAMCPYDVGVASTTYEIYDYGTDDVPEYLYDSEGNTVKWYYLDSSNQKIDASKCKIYDQQFQVPEGCYFVLGDHRNTSYDSRYWANQYVKEDEIISRTVLKLYPNLEYLVKE